MPKLKGVDGFESYYSAFYGERWGNLKNALMAEPQYLNWPSSGSHSDPYYLDAASVLAAYSLPLSEAHSILDMCAAPGGKSLILAHRMNNDAQLLCNERSAPRRNRLLNVLNDHLSEQIRKRIRVSAQDGALMCQRETEIFDCILLDAPCSSERHVLTDKKYLEQWTPARIKHLALSQWALLSSAFRLLKSNGMILYATCALSPRENDEVIKRLIKKFSTAQIIDIDVGTTKKNCIHSLPDCEKTEHGFQILPDIQNGAGPLYFSLVKKLNILS